MLEDNQENSPSWHLDVCAFSGNLLFCRFDVEGVSEKLTILSLQCRQLLSGNYYFVITLLTDQLANLPFCHFDVRSLFKREILAFCNFNVSGFSEKFTILSDQLKQVIGKFTILSL